MRNLLPLLVCCSLAGVWALECPRAGVYRHPKDCTRFYTCREDGQQGFHVQQHTCPPGQAVSRGAWLRCEDIERVPGCSPPPPPPTSLLGDVSSRANHPLCNGTLVHCSNCTHLVSCSYINSEYVNPRVDDCSATDEPYCDSQLKRCTAEIPSGCNLPGYVCTGMGVFPDPNQCDLYHVCFQSSYQTHSCLGQLQYNSAEFRCTVNSSCAPVTCEGIGMYPYDPDSRYRLLCTADGKNELYACPGNTRVNPVSGECEFSCGRMVGLHVDMANCTRFNRCEEDGTQSIQDCPAGLAFNPNSLACEDQRNVQCPPL